MGPSDLVSIMTFSSKLNVEEDFTDDKERLTAAIRGFHIGLASDLAVEGGDGSTGEDTGAAFSADETEFNIFNTDRKLSALESAAKMLAVLPEKKALLYFSSGVGKSGVENQSQLRSTINAAVRANVSFYPIDARGLTALPPGGDASKAAPKGNAIFTGQAHQSQRDRFNDQQETLVSLAADTGGKAFLDNNDLALGIVQARNEVRSYYVLGYYSTNDRSDGKFRRVQVKLASQPSAKLEYRGGYFCVQSLRQIHGGRQRAATGRGAHAGRPDYGHAGGGRGQLFPPQSQDVLRAGFAQDSRLRNSAREEGLERRNRS